MDKLILVLYVDVGDQEDEAAIDHYVKSIGAALFPDEVTKNLDGGLTFVIPRRGGGTVLEAINPKFVIDQNVFNEFRTKMEILNTNLTDFIEQRDKNDKS